MRHLSFKCLILLFFSLIMLLPIQPVRAAGITFDSANAACTSGSGTTVSYSQTISASATIIFLSIVDRTTGATFSLVKVGTTAATHYATADTDDGVAMETQVWYVISPPTGSQTVTATSSISAKLCLGSSSYTGSTTSSPIDTGTSFASSTFSGSQALTISTAVANEMVYQTVGFSPSTNTLSYSSGQTQRFNVVGTGSGAKPVDNGAELLEASSGSNSLTVSMTGTNNFGFSIVAFKPPTGASLTQTASDTVTISDQALKTVSKAASESITITDSALKYSSKLLTEAVTIADSLLKLNQKAASETITAITDTGQKTVGKVLTEIATLSDNALKYFSKTVTETLSLTDLANANHLKILSASDALNILDGAVRSVTKTLSDGSSLTDTVFSPQFPVRIVTVTITEVALGLSAIIGFYISGVGGGGAGGIAPGLVLGFLFAFAIGAGLVLSKRRN